MIHIRPFNEGMSKDDVNQLINWKLIRYVEDLLTKYEDEDETITTEIAVFINGYRVYTKINGKESYITGRYFDPEDTTLQYSVSVKSKKLESSYFDFTAIKEIVTKVRAKFPDETISM